jgi:putative transposase
MERHSMPRAKRHYLPSGGYVWHITHRCHKKEFLLKLKKDKLTWLKWLFQAKKIYHLKILNYVVTSNHIHLLVHDDGRPNAIAKSIHLAAGQTAQRYNFRKNRCGAFWQDRYHATAVDTGSYLMRCMVYIDLNMVRAGVVRHPEAWPFGGYTEIQNRKTRYCLIDEQAIMRLFGFRDSLEHRDARRQWVDDALWAACFERESCWTESIAVGTEEFVNKIKNELGARGIGKKVEGNADRSVYKLKENDSVYETFLGSKSVV